MRKRCDAKAAKSQPSNLPGFHASGGPGNGHALERLSGFQFPVLVEVHAMHHPFAAVVRSSAPVREDTPPTQSLSPEPQTLNPDTQSLTPFNPN